MAFKRVEIELILIACATYTSFIYLLRYFFINTFIGSTCMLISAHIHRLALGISRRLFRHLVTITTCLRPSLDLILYLLCLFLVRISYLYALANLLLL